MTDAATLRPYRARMAQVTRLLIADREREEHEYSFAWPAAREAAPRR